MHEVDLLYTRQGNGRSNEDMVRLVYEMCNHSYLCGYNIIQLYIHTDHDFIY